MGKGHPLMRIVADENIPYVHEAFTAFGDVVTMPGRAIGPEAVQDARILLVRSITRVDAALLEESSVNFVGTATIGEDHVDKRYLSSLGIGFTSAPGCNANSVAEYVVAALFVLAARKNLDLRKLRLGIVGHGNVGSRVGAKARALGMQIVVNDAPLAGATCEPFYRPMAEVFACDIVTVHVPLERKGPFATHHLVNEPFLESMRPGSILINTSRGAVVDNRALLNALEDGHLSAAILDVFENEPTPDPDLVAAADIATPHIAGYSFDGKVRGTELIRKGACRFFGRDSVWDPVPLLPAPECPAITLEGTGLAAVAEAVRTVYDIEADDERLRSTMAEDRAARGAAFDKLRKNYPRRREFTNTRVTLTQPCEETQHMLQGLGFHVARPDTESP